MAFIRQIKRLNPDAEIIIQHYIPTPHPDGMYGVAGASSAESFVFPKSPEEWASPPWYNFTTRTDPALPWLLRRTKRLIDWFEIVMECRWPTAQDITMPRWAGATLRTLSTWRYAFGVYAWQYELELAQRFLQPRKSKLESV